MTHLFAKCSYGHSLLVAVLPDQEVPHQGGAVLISPSRADSFYPSIKLGMIFNYVIQE